jgi:hypothetical protein
MVQFQDSISEHLHHHTHFNMFFDQKSEAHHVRILSCSGPKASIWLTTQPIYPTFWLFPQIYSMTFCMWFGLSHPSIVGILRCVCTHPINLMGIPPVTSCSWQWTHWNPWCNLWHLLPPVGKMLVFKCEKNNYMCFFQPHSPPLINVLTLCLLKITFAP